MLIDWFTVGAQILNFLILVWLLKRFLYKPVLNAIDAREQRIAAELKDAAEQKLAAQKERDEFNDRSRALNEERGALIGKATEEAKALREHLLADAQREADSLRTQQQRAMRSDQTRLGDEITRLAAQEVFAIARKTLSDLAGAELEERMGEVFTRQLREMNVEAKEPLAVALRTSSEPAIVRSTYAMPIREQATIQNALNEAFGAEVRVRFDTAPSVIDGIELSVGGQKLAWSIAEYLKGLEQALASLLDAQATPVPQAQPAPLPEAQPAPLPPPAARQRATEAA
jgi:F-type H+-transporting ATPase subunit b